MKRNEIEDGDGDAIPQSSTDYLLKNYLERMTNNIKSEPTEITI